MTAVVAPTRLPDPPAGGRRFMDAEQRYRASDLAAIEPFDVALASKADFAVVIRPPLIVSKRFYELCVARKWKAKYVPVAVDPV